MSTRLGTLPSLVSFSKKRDDGRMFRPRPDFFQRRHRVRARWLALSLGLLLTLAGAWNVVRSSFDPNVSALGESVTSPQETGALTVSGGMLLTGTILSAKLAEKRTIIADVRGRQRVYARGDEILDGGKVVEINRDYIVLRRNGRLETLEFSWNAVVRILERSARGARGAVQETPPRDDLDILREAMFTHPELLLELVGVTPVVEGERFLGYRVMEPEDHTFLEFLGLKPGDVLIAVNGMPLDTPDYGVQALDALSGTGKLTFTVRRGSEILVLSN